MTFDWTAERVTRLKELHALGLSCSIIAQRLGGLSRSAVIGKLHRLGISRHTQPLVRKKTASGQRRRRRAPWLGKSPDLGIAADRAARMIAEYESLRSQPEIEIPEHERKQLIDLEPNDCRWGIGDPKEPGFHFCGRPKLMGVSYCAFHATRAFQAPVVARSRAPSEQPTEAKAMEAA